MSNRLRWDDIPDGASIAISKKSAMQMRGGGPRSFMWGMACGAVCVLALQSCDSDDSKKDDSPKGNKPSATATPKPGN